jgi:ribosomal protein L27
MVFMKVSLFLLFVMVVAGGLSSCSKASDDIFITPLTTTISVINAGPDTLNIYQRGTRLNSGSNLLPGGQYTSLQVATGTNNYQFKKAGRAEVLIDVPFTIDTPATYTMFVGGQTAAQVFLLRDTLPKKDTTYIRFVNASPLDNTLDLTIGSNSNHKKIGFKSATKFIPVLSGQVPYFITKTGETTQIAKGTLTLTKNYTYTLFTKGVLDGKGTSLFGARILVARQ